MSTVIHGARVSKGKGISPESNTYNLMDRILLGKSSLNIISIITDSPVCQSYPY
jgi:hypothetical protein